MDWHYILTTEDLDVAIIETVVMPVRKEVNLSVVIPVQHLFIYNASKIIYIKILQTIKLLNLVFIVTVILPWRRLICLKDCGTVIVAA